MRYQRKVGKLRETSPWKNDNEGRQIPHRSEGTKLVGGRWENVHPLTGAEAFL